MCAQAQLSLPSDLVALDDHTSHRTRARGARAHTEVILATGELAHPRYPVTAADSWIKPVHAHPARRRRACNAPPHLVQPLAQRPRPIRCSVCDPRDPAHLLDVREDLLEIDRVE